METSRNFRLPEDNPNVVVQLLSLLPQNFIGTLSGMLRTDPGQGILPHTALVFRSGVYTLDSFIRTGQGNIKEKAAAAVNILIGEKLPIEIHFRDCSAYANPMTFFTAIGMCQHAVMKGYTGPLHFSFGRVDSEYLEADARCTFYLGSLSTSDPKTFSFHLNYNPGREKYFEPMLNLCEQQGLKEFEPAI